MDVISRSVFSVGDVKNFDFTETSCFIKELLDRNVNIYEVTTLTRVSLDEKSLTHLENDLLDRIAGCSAVSIQLVDNKNRMPFSLKVTIKMNKRSEYECLFASVSSIQKQNSSYGVRLPILCVLSGTGVAYEVHKAFEIIFGCIISNISVQKDNGRWLAAISINEFFRRGLEIEFTLVFKIKSEMKISCNLPFGELYHFWRDCIVTNSNKLMVNEIETFFDKFILFFESSYGIKISQFEIVSILLTEMAINFENKFEIKSNLAPLIYCILSYIESDLMASL